MRNPRHRIAVLLVLLCASLYALHRRTALQVYAYNLGHGGHRLLGKPAPELPPGLRDLSGAPVQLGALRGQVVLLHFFTRSCGNCKSMLPQYTSWAERYRDAGLRVVGVHTPETEDEVNEPALRAFVRDRGLRWPVIPDNDQGIFATFKVEVWPTILLIDRAGVLRHQYLGDDVSDAIEYGLKNMLREPG